jgi:uncharacterized protein
MPYAGPLLTRTIADALHAARDAGQDAWTGSLDLGRTTARAALSATHWRWQGRDWPYPGKLKDRSIYWWDGDAFAPVSRYGRALYKLVPTQWGAPTFEIDGIKMLPTAKISPYEDARAKVALACWTPAAASATSPPAVSMPVQPTCIRSRRAGTCCGCAR